ncbi:hypothetical protein [Bacillus sp. Marseille-P3661]|uniref:hypothetical protein n=1 Tax=Bacillus sp. Marseille-P3661 TaxID=1936234 RepID=UPI000C855BAD|nr:hypothetical protein [Bacillus sp. Marseille-P3661]
MILNIFSLDPNRQKYPLTETFAVIAIIGISFVVGNILLARAIEISEKHSHLFNVDAITRVMPIYLVREQPSFSRDDYYNEHSLYYTDISLTTLIQSNYIQGGLDSESFDSITSLDQVYGDHSYIRVIKVKDQVIYQIYLTAVDQKQTSIINTITNPTLVGEKSIQTMVPIDTLDTEDVVLPKY